CAPAPAAVTRDTYPPPAHKAWMPHPRRSSSMAVASTSLGLVRTWYERCQSGQSPTLAPARGAGSDRGELHADHGGAAAVYHGQRVLQHPGQLGGIGHGHPVGAAGSL